jgi:hypothetical protein
MTAQRATTPEQFAYRDRLRIVAWPLRLGGLVSIMAGCAVLVAFRYALIPWLLAPGFVLIVFGWGLYGFAIWKRTQWAKANPYQGPG